MYLTSLAVFSFFLPCEICSKKILKNERNEKMKITEKKDLFCCLICILCQDEILVEDGCCFDLRIVVVVVVVGME